MFSYTAYGLVIHSARRLPELAVDRTARAVTAGDVFVLDHSRKGATNTSYSPDIDLPVCRWVGPDETLLSWQGVGAYLVRHGCEIHIDPAPMASEDIVRLFLLGPVLAALLHQRGLLVLHASAVAMNGNVVAFLGNGGWGKSTTARLLHERGHSFVADDLIAVFPDAEGAPVVYPGIFQFKLWPEAAAVMGDNPEGLPRIRPGYEKRARRVAPTLPLREPLPLRRIYVLGQGDGYDIVSIPAPKAIFELVAHTYTHKLLQGEALSRHFRQCVQLVNAVPIGRLERKYSLAGLPEIADLIEQDMAHFGVSRASDHPWT